MMDKVGKVIVPAIYHSLTPLKDILEEKTHPILMAVNDKEKMGLIDTSTGKPLTDFRYDRIIEYISDGMITIGIDDKYGFIDIKGKEVIKPIYDGAGLFAAGLALVEKDGERFYIDKTGKRVR